MFVEPFINPFQSNPFHNVKSDIYNYKNAFSLPTQQEAPPKDNRYLNFVAGRDGCCAYRRGFLENHINMNSMGDSTSLTKMILEKQWYADIKTISLQRQASDHQKEFMQFLKSIQPEMGFKLIYEVDDVVFREEIPNYNASKHAFDNDKIRQNCIDMINMVDEVTVTCEYMRDLYIEKTGKKEITVVPNFMPYWWIGHQYNYNKIISDYEKNKKKPRIVYAGSGAHFDVKNLNNQKDDFSHVIKFFVDNRHKYQFIFIGAYPPPLHKYVVNGEIEMHPWKTLLEYPNFLASLNAQLFLAPLQNNSFNKSKSDIKYIEAAQLGIPCLVQNMETYENALPELKFNDSDELESKVEEFLNWKNRAKYYKLIPQLRNIGEKRFLEHPENVGCFMESLDTPFGSPHRKFLSKWN